MSWSWEESRRLYAGEWYVVEVCHWCERPMRVNGMVRDDNQLAWRVDRRGVGYEHIVNSLPCNQTHDLMKAERLKLVRVRYSKKWEDVLARATQIMPKFQFVCVVNPTMQTDHQMGNEQYRLYVPEHVVTLMSLLGEPAAGMTQEIAERALSVYGADELAEAVQEINAASVLKWFGDIDNTDSGEDATQSMNAPRRKR